MCQQAFTQTPSVSGTVKDATTSTGIAGVTITVKGTKVVTQTDASGNFTIAAARGKVLVFTSVGYESQDVTVGQSSTVSVNLVTSSQSLSNVIVVGYGSQTKKELASSVSTVSAKQFQSAVITTVDQALQGRATGVQITAASGEPGADAVIRIRGNNSLSGNNEPLYVVDGFPMPPYSEAPGSSYGSTNQNGLYGINPNDIESIQVLKDASATAIYGSRGANGVIMITTKAGKRGEGRIELTSKTTFGDLRTPIPMMNSQQYVDIRNEFADLTNTPRPFDPDTVKTNTDWLDAITHNSAREDLSLSVSGGGEKTSYYFSANYLTDKGVLLGSKNTRGSIRVNLNNEVNRWYTNKVQLSAVKQVTNRAITGSRGFPQVAGPVLDALRASPVSPIDLKGTDDYGIPFINPYLELTSKTDDSKNDNVIANIENWFRLRSDLQLVVTLGANQNATRRQTFFPDGIGEGYYTKGQANNSVANTNSYNINGYFLYDKLFSNVHKINLTLGGEWNYSVLEQLSAVGQGFDLPYFGVNNIGSALSQQIGSYKEDRTIESGFFRANYSYKGKYVLNASVRLDGASPFSENKKFGWFPAVGLAWNLSEEEFMQRAGFVNNAKLRVSYGVTGSQAISPYSSLARYGNSFYQVGYPSTIVTSVYQTSLGNSDLTWETTSQLNAGIDFNILNDRLVFSFDYYNKVTDKLLQPRALPSQSGFSSITDNYGKIGNKGFEISLQGDIVRNKNFRFTSRVAISRNRNTLINLGDRTAEQYIGLGGNLQSGTASVLIPGKEIGYFYGYHVIGLAQASDFTNGVPNYAYAGGPTNQIPGTWIYEDRNKDGKITADDRMILGNSNPTFTYGWTNDINWKNFGLNLFFTGSQGNDVLNVTRFYLNSGLLNNSGVVFNQSEDWYKNRWTTQNPTNDTRYPGIQTSVATSDINNTFLENGSYFRLKTLTLSYTLPSTKVIKNPRLFFTGTNLITITKYTGFDPEVSSYGQSLLQQGIDFGAYPASKTYTIGVTCTF